MANIIPINKDAIPYNFSIVLSGRTYDMKINYNKIYDKFSLDLSYNGEVLVSGERMSYGIPMFDQVSTDRRGNKDERFFDELLVAYDMSENENRVSFNNLGESVFLWVIEREEA